MCAGVVSSFATPWGRTWNIYHRPGAGKVLHFKTWIPVQGWL